MFKNTLTCLEKGYLTKAHRSNEEYTREKISWGSLSDIQKYVVLDPQTSGGLLLSVSPEAAASIVSKLSASFSFVKIVGSVSEKKSSDVYLD